MSNSKCIITWPRETINDPNNDYEPPKPIASRASDSRAAGALLMITLFLPSSFRRQHGIYDT